MSEVFYDTEPTVDAMKMKRSADKAWWHSLQWPSPKITSTISIRRTTTRIHKYPMTIYPVHNSVRRDETIWLPRKETHTLRPVSTSTVVRTKVMPMARVPYAYEVPYPETLTEWGTFTDIYHEKQKQKYKPTDISLWKRGELFQVTTVPTSNSLANEGLYDTKPTVKATKAKRSDASGPLALRSNLQDFETTTINTWVPTTYLYPVRSNVRNPVNRPENKYTKGTDMVLIRSTKTFYQPRKSTVTVLMTKALPQARFPYTYLVRYPETFTRGGGILKMQEGEKSIAALQKRDEHFQIGTTPTSELETVTLYTQVPETWRVPVRGTRNLDSQYKPVYSYSTYTTRPWRHTTKTFRHVPVSTVTVVKTKVMPVARIPYTYHVPFAETVTEGGKIVELAKRGEPTADVQNREHSELW